MKTVSLPQLIFKEQQKIKIHKTSTGLKFEENYLSYSGIVLAFSIFCLNTIFDSPTLISNPKRNLDQVCRYATYYVGRRYMRKHARILHTLLWLMHQLSQSRKRCCISTFFITISTKNYYNESPISSIHHYSTVGDFEIFQQNITQMSISAIQQGASNSYTRFFGISFLLIPHQQLLLRCAYINRITVF